MRLFLFFKKSLERASAHLEQSLRLLELSEGLMEQSLRLYLERSSPLRGVRGVLERPTGLLEPSGTTWNARRALLRPLYCLLVGDNISVLLSALGTPEGLLEQSLRLYLERRRLLACSLAP